MEKESTNLYIRRDIKEKAIKAIKSGIFPGINSLSSLVELALEDILRDAASPVLVRKEVDEV
ncbi:MAG: hypothetical protein DRP08_07195 [Candidatus Aenigmatarchaeota archaeon]|nr:MAG: hypothetical protein DRP08_07195 [Candidatus Aenigmarchaeota archaeon]